MIVGVLEGFEYKHFKRLYGVMELAMVIGYISAYIAPKPLMYLVYTVASLQFLTLKMPERTPQLTLTVSMSVVPIAFSEFFLHMGLALAVPMALKLSVGEDLLPLTLSLVVLIRALVQLLGRKRFNALDVAIFRTIEAFPLYSLSVIPGHIALDISCG